MIFYSQTLLSLILSHYLIKLLVVEYGGRWKMLHYYAKLFFNNSIISPELDDDIITVYYIQDGLPPFDAHVSENVND